MLFSLVTVISEWVAKRFHIVVETVLRCDDTKGFELLPKRWVVERTFAYNGQRAH
jgi:putative transposase